MKTSEGMNSLKSKIHLNETSFEKYVYILEEINCVFITKKTQ
jgi:hypothetical protein